MSEKRGSVPPRQTPLILFGAQCPIFDSCFRLARHPKQIAIASQKPTCRIRSGAAHVITIGLRTTRMAANRLKPVVQVRCSRQEQLGYLCLLGLTSPRLCPSEIAAFRLFPEHIIGRRLHIAGILSSTHSTGCHSGTRQCHCQTSLERCSGVTFPHKARWSS